MSNGMKGKKCLDVSRNKKKPECLTRRIYYFVLTRAWNFPNEYVQPAGRYRVQYTLPPHSLRAGV